MGFDPVAAAGAVSSVSSVSEPVVPLERSSLQVPSASCRTPPTRSPAPEAGTISVDEIGPGAMPTGRGAGSSTGPVILVWPSIASAGAGRCSPVVGDVSLVVLSRKEVATLPSLKIAIVWKSIRTSFPTPAVEPASPRPTWYRLISLGTACLIPSL